MGIGDVGCEIGDFGLRIADLGYEMWDVGFRIVDRGKKKNECRNVLTPCSMPHAYNFKEV